MLIKLADGTELVSGTITRDAELKFVGDKRTAKTAFSVAAGKRKDTTTIFVNCIAWKKLAETLSTLKKGDAFFGIGKTDSREYNGKQYEDFVLEFGIAATAQEVAKMAATGDKLDGLTNKLSEAGFHEIADNDPDSQLPF